MSYQTFHKDGFTISTNKNYLDKDVIVDFLTNQAYWAKNNTADQILKSIDNTPLCFGLYEGDPEASDAKLAGFARVITDLAMIAYLADGFIIEEYRGRGLFKWLIGIIVEHPDLQDLRRFLLVTKDLHPLYAQFGFEPLGDDAVHFMQINKVKLN